MKRTSEPAVARIGLAATLLLAVLALAPTSVAAQAGCVQPLSGLVSWWPGDGNADDIVCSSDGILHGVTFDAGQVSQGCTSSEYSGQSGSISKRRFMVLTLAALAARYSLFLRCIVSRLILALSDSTSRWRSW